MFAPQLFTTVLAFLTMGVQVSPLSPRVVIAPKITNPQTGSVWPIGTVQIVTWDTSNFPPDSQITNPIGNIILGFDENGRLHNDAEHPLAQNFKLRDGSVKITVPNVPPRDNYYVILMGDSGNASPQFTITTTSALGSGASTLIATPIPITGSVITRGTSTDTPSTATDSTTDPLPIATTPSSSSSTSSSAASSSNSSATSTSGALSLYAPERLSFKALSLCMAFMIMLIVV